MDKRKILLRGSRRGDREVVLPARNFPFKRGVRILQGSAGVFITHSVCKLKRHPILGVKNLRNALGTTPSGCE